MLNFLKFKKQGGDEQKKPGLLSKLKSGLKKTRHQLSDGLANLVLGRKTIDSELFDDIETLLITADVGIDVTQEIMDVISKQVSRKQLKDTEALYQALKQCLLDILTPSSVPLEIPSQDKPFVILMVGINGAGKTTTIGKLAKRLQQEGKSVMLAAGDTFRAAAVEQLQVWGERNNIPVIAQHSGADSASVVFDAVTAANARKTNVLIADTAGRLHTQTNLMEELKKISRVLKKIDENAPHETLLVIDASNGQNALQQAKQFKEAVNITGIAITKLDGTAKGGIIFAIVRELGVPIRFIGVGEQLDDLQVFNADSFIDALFEGQPQYDSLQQDQ